MYSWEDVNTALASGRLTEGLFRLEQIARTQGNEELANWAETELNSYTIDDVASSFPWNGPRYRLVTAPIIWYPVNLIGNEVSAAMLNPVSASFCLPDGVRYIESAID